MRVVYWLGDVCLGISFRDGPRGRGLDGKEFAKPDIGWVAATYIRIRN